MDVAAVVGPLVVKILPKLVSVIGEKRNQLHDLEDDIECIKLDLQSIQELIGHSRGISISDLWIQRLRRLADDIEDFIDLFQVGKKLSRIHFATEIRKLKQRSKDTLEQLQLHIRTATLAGQVVPPAADRPVGVEDPEEELVALLQSQSAEEGKLKVISIAGFGGLGMTRLARKVYNDVRDQFPLHAWVRAAGRSVEEVRNEIKEIHDQVLLNTVRYLIVIEDVKTQELSDVLLYFSWADGVGGRIITTTAINHLPAATCCSCGNGSLLAMDSTSQVFMQELTESGFVESCCKLRRDTLERIQFSNNEILSRSVVQDLLLYFCMFPRDHPVRCNPLIRRWLAEGLVFNPQPETENLSICCEDIAAKNLQMLINCNAIQPIQARNYEKVKRCQTSGMMLNSISNKSQNFITILCGQTTEIVTPGDVRRLSLHLKSTANGRLNLPKGLSRLYTLAVFPGARVACYEANLNYANYKLLRVLDLKECADLKGEHVKKICDLFLLKYLSLGDSIGELPSKIAQLRLLETLDMRRTQVVRVPKEVLQLPRLKHLLGKLQIFEVILGKKSEEHLPRDSELQRLSGFVTDKSERFSRLMSHMKRLRKVKIWCNSTDAAELTHLLEAMEKFIREGIGMPTMDRSLSIDFQGCSEPFMNSLQASSYLTSLKLRGELTRFPQFDRSCYIEDMCLSGTNQSWHTILTGLRELFQKLKYLKLVEDKLGNIVIESKHFRSLKGICLVGKHSLEGIQTGAMPRLVSLHILCEALGDRPGIEINHMAGLKEVALRSDVQDAIKFGWQAAAMVHPNRPNLLFIDLANPRNRGSPAQERNGTTTNRTSAETIVKPRRLVYEAGEPLLPDDEVQRLPTQMKLLHDTIMMMARNRDDYVQHFKVEVPKDFGFFLDRHHDIFDINFEDIFLLFNLFRLDTMLVRLWALYQAQESRRLPSCAFGIIDPVIMNEYYIREAKEVLINFITESLIYHKNKDFLLMPYNPPDHWILIVIHKPSRMIYYFDSQRSAKRDFSGIKEVLEAAFWEYNLRGGGAESKSKKLIHKFNFPCRQQPENSVTCGYYVCAHIDAFVISHNPQWNQDHFNNFIHDLAEEKYDWRKDFARIQKIFAYVINNEVIRPSGDFYAGVQLPPSRRPASTSEAS